MRTQLADDTKPIRFRAATLEQAVVLAEQSLGARTRVVEANQLRRGGIGGFFASDLGVEISVVVDDETVEDALERMVDEVATEEREHWRERGGLVTADHIADEFAAALRAIEEATTPATSPVDEPEVPAAADVSPAHLETDRPVMPRKVRFESGFEPAILLSTASCTEAQPAPATHSAPEPELVPDPAPVAEAAVATAPATSLSRVERLEAAFASLRESSPMQVKRRPSAPTQRQVELVVAAAEQLVDCIVTRSHGGNISVRVVMRNSEGAEVEAFAGLDTSVGSQS